MKRGSGESWDHEEDAAPSEKEREDHSDFSSPALHHCTFNHLTYLEANWQGACVTYFQNTRPLGNERAQLHILALLIFPALALPLPPPQRTLHFTPRTSFPFPPYSLFPPCLYILSPQFRRARKEDTLLPSLECLDIPSNALGLSLSITPLESLFWSPNVNQIPLTYELLRVYNKFPLQHL